jgi:hypothetical protein
LSNELKFFTQQELVTLRRLYHRSFIGCYLTTTAMNTKKTMSMVALVTAAAIFALSSVAVMPVLATTSSSDTDSSSSDTSSSSSDTSSSSSDTSSSSSDSTNYDDFQKCLSDAETGGSATEQQIRDCFSETYSSSVGSGSSTGTSGSSTGGSGSSTGTSGSSTGGSSTGTP